MTKVEAPTLEEAYAKASEVLECSISELQCEVVQHPTKGILGFLKKNAIVVATCKDTTTKSKSKLQESKRVISEFVSTEESMADEIIATVKEEVSEQEKIVETILTKDTIVDGFFETDVDVIEDKNESIVYDELALRIENELKNLFSYSCFEIDVIEVDVRDNTALIFIDGDDAALLIGKEGYRYNALSYMLFNWLHTKYELFIKLEIAEFLTSQQEMIRSYIKPVIETVEKTGRAKTRFLDGILVQIALEQLREHFPDKYVAVKTSKDGKKFVVINEFNNK
jgi:spoIIIJ-associated protein